MPNMKKIWKFLSSMGFAIFLLVLLAAYCALASVVPQGEDYAWYAQQYSPRIAAVILLLHLDDAFHSGFFIALSGFLILNLLACNLVRFPALLRQTRQDPKTGLPDAPAEAQAEGVRDPTAVFTALGLAAPRRFTAEDGREVLYAVKHRAGLWGPWVCHLGMVLLILGFGLGQALRQEYTIYGVPGQTRPIGDTGLFATIRDFRVETRPDGSVEQYVSDITVRDTVRGESRTASVQVNAPARLFGLSFYQNSTGWAARVRVTKAGEPLQEEILCTGESVTVADKPELEVLLYGVYPDYELVPGEGPRNRSDTPSHPGYLYIAYYMGQILGMNLLDGEEPLVVDEYTFTFSEPQTYTLLQAKRDAFAWLALLGAGVLTIGLVLAFYLQPVKVWAVEEDGGWTVRAKSRRGGVLFRQRFDRAAGNQSGSHEEP